MKKIDKRVTIIVIKDKKEVSRFKNKHMFKFVKIPQSFLDSFILISHYYPIMFVSLVDQNVMA